MPKSNTHISVAHKFDYTQLNCPQTSLHTEKVMPKSNTHISMAHKFDQTW